MTESASSPEQAAKFADLLAASEEFLEGRDAFPGRAYKPRYFPLRWLFGWEAPLGYKIDESFLALNNLFTRNSSKSDLENWLGELEINGSTRSRHEYGTSVGNWVGSTSLRSYQKLEFSGLRLIPATAEIIYDLEIRIGDVEGNPRVPYERFIYSNQGEGLWEFTADEDVLHQIEVGHEEKYVSGNLYAIDDYEQDPLVRATMYLRGENPLSRTIPPH